MESFRASCAHSAEECGGCAAERRHRQTLIALQEIRDRLSPPRPFESAQVYHDRRCSLLEDLVGNVGEYRRLINLPLLPHDAVLHERTINFGKHIDHLLDELDPTWRTR